MLRSALFIACLALAACGGSKPASPAAPTAPPAPAPTTPAPTAPITALSLSAPPDTVRVGNTFQLTATATFSDGQSATSGFIVTWGSGDPRVATVSTTGLVTVKATGAATISASAGGVSALKSFYVGGRRLSGLVRMAPTAALLAVPGARVTVIDGPYSGASVTTDAYGTFTLFEVDGLLNLRFSAPGFDDRQATGDTESSGIRIEMTRSDHPVIDSAEWAVPSGDARQVRQAAMTFTMRSSGRVDLSAYASLSSDESAPLCSELRDEGNGLVWSEKHGWQGLARTTVTLDGGRRYTLKINDCDAGTGKPAIYEYHLFAIHPA